MRVETTLLARETCVNNFLHLQVKSAKQEKVSQEGAGIISSVPFCTRQQFSCLLPRKTSRSLRGIYFLLMNDMIIIMMMGILYVT